MTWNPVSRSICVADGTELILYIPSLEDEPEIEIYWLCWNPKIIKFTVVELALFIELIVLSTLGVLGVFVKLSILLDIECIKGVELWKLIP